MIINLYRNQSATLRVVRENMEQVRILPPILLNLQSEQIFQEPLDLIEEEIAIS